MSQIIIFKNCQMKIAVFLLIFFIINIYAATFQNASGQYNCYYRCQSCTDVSPQSCTSCFANYILANKTCIPCADNCLSCVAVTGLCQTCASQFYLSQSTWTCRPCPIGAEACTFSAIQECLPGYYLVNSICLFCIANCQTCSDPYSCSVCNTGYYLTTEQTCAQCQIAYCSSCDQSGACSLCSNSRYGASCDQLCPLNCEICDSSACYQCSQGYYQTSEGTCEALSILCESGIDPFTCISCLQEISFLDGHDCYPFTYVRLTNMQIYQRPLNQMALFSGELVNCGNYWLAKDDGTLSISINIQPSYKLKLKIQIMTRSNATKNITIASNQLKETFVGSIHSIFTYNCYNHSWTFTNFQTQFTPMFTASRKNQTLNLSIKGNGSIGVGQVLIEQYLCLVSQCGLCLSAYSCMQCLSPFLLENNKCLAQCSSGYYLTQQLMTCTLSCPTYYFPNLADYSCTPCISPCLACRSSSQCLSCSTGWFLLGNTCQTSCPSGYYSNNTLNSCVACQYPCATCDFSASNCTSCSLGFLDKSNGNCVMSCSAGYFSNFSSITCSLCSAQCLTCEFSSSRCTSCASPLFLNPNSTCLSSCDSTYAANALLNRCEKCQYPCRTCNTSAATCLTCFSGYLQGQKCVSSCSFGYYSNFQYKECLPCPSNCLSCVSKLQCTSCKSGFYYSEFLQSCDSSCPAGSFASSNYTCSLCRSPCSECLNSTYCLSCQGYLFVYYYGACQLSCPKGTFVISNQTTNFKYCQPCGTNCSVCISANNCVTCANSSSLYQGACLISCPDTTYNLKGVCSNCSFPCFTCQASDICLSCVAGYYYYSVSNSCLRICPSRFYALGRYCQPCNPICQLCNNGSTNCLTCASGYFKNSNGTCSQACGFGYYTYSIQRICKKCASPCIQCLSSNLCTSCNASSIYPYLFRKSCVASCPNRYFANSTFSCQLCSTNCLFCSKAFDNCTQCDGDHYLFSNISNKCVVNCPDRYYPNSAGQCTPCLPPCLLCVSQSSCLSCISQAYYFYNGNCFTSCPFGHYSASNICESCDLACLQCFGNSLNCTQCPPNLFLMSQNGTNNSICLKTCPLYYYPDVMNQICSLCVSPCRLCYTASRCISCQAGFVLQYDTCLLNCISGFFNEGGICKLCKAPCATCTSNTNCLSCITNYFFDQNQKKCLNQCPSSTYSFQTSNRDLQCLSCPTSCLQCYDSISCRSCQPNSLLPYLQGTACQATCTDGYYAIPDSLTCQWCGWGCLTCGNSGVCTQCSNSYLYGGVCQTQCPIGYYGSISFSCEACISPCYDCYNAANCAFCIPGYFLYLTHCLSKCPQDQWALISLSICNQTCNAPYFKNPSDKTCVTSCPAYYDSDGNCVYLCPSELMANQTFGCEQCATADCSKRLQYQLVSYQENGLLFVILVFNLPLDNLNELSAKSLAITLNPSVAIDPSQLNLSGLRTLTEVISIENSITVVDRHSLSITLQINLQKYGQFFSGVISSTVKDLNVLTTGGYPLQALNATVALDEYQANSGGSFAKYFGWIVSCILLLTYIANLICGSERNAMLAIDGIQTIHALFYLSVWNHPLLENYMLGLGIGTLRAFITNLSIRMNLWDCSPKCIVLYGYCNTYIQLIFPLLALIIIVVIILICRSISAFEGKHKFLWNHASSIWWIAGMCVGISSFKGVTSAAIGEFIISTVLLICFIVFSLVIGFKIVENVYSNSFSDGCFFWDLKKKKAEHILSNLHCLLMVVRRVVIVIAAGLGYKHPLSSLFVVTLLTICIFSNIIINRPFKNYGMIVGAAQLLFGLILVLIQMYIVNTARLSNAVWNGFGSFIFVLVLIYTLILLVLAIQQTVKGIKKLHLKRINETKGEDRQKSMKSIKQVQSQASKKQSQKPPIQKEDCNQQEKVGDETQHHLMKASLASKRSQSSHIFSQYGSVDYQKQPTAPKLLLKIQKQSDEYHSFKKIEK